MIHHTPDICPQGSANWVKARMGLPTASEFHRIVTPTGKLSSQAEDYAYRLIAEIIMKQPSESLDGLEWIERGKEMEPKAVMAYEFENDMKTEEVGFITTDNGEIGASPDRIVGEIGLLEVKCPSPQVHIKYMVEGPGDKYHPQVQGQLFVTGRKWADFLSYHPYMPRVLIRTERDVAYIEKLSVALNEFVKMKKEFMQKILSQGVFTVPEPVYSIAEKEIGKTAGEEYAPEELLSAG